MKLINEYLEHARHFERMAGETKEAGLKEIMLKQAADYLRLAEKRAAQKGLPMTPPASHGRTPRPPSSLAD